MSNASFVCVPNTLHLIFISVYEKQVFHHANKALFIIARRREFEIPFYALLLLLVVITKAAMLQ